jgi:hypothetical protein
MNNNMAKFFSKQSNYTVILRPGYQENRITGEPMRPAISLKFENGFVERFEEDIIELAQKSSAFNRDFFMQDEDPLKGIRKESEPRHQIQEIRYGQPEKGVASPKVTIIPDELKKLITDQASEMAKTMVKEMLPTAVKEVLAGIAATQPLNSNEIQIPSPNVHVDTPTNDGDAGKPPFCTECDSRGVRHKSTCPKSVKKEVDGV